MARRTATNTAVDRSEMLEFAREPSPRRAHDAAGARATPGVPGCLRRRRRGPVRHLHLSGAGQGANVRRDPCRQPARALRRLGRALGAGRRRREVLDLPEALDPLVEYYRSISGEHPTGTSTGRRCPPGQVPDPRHPDPLGPVATGGFPPESIQDPLAGAIWSSDAGAIVSIDSSGLATAQTAGVANIHASLGTATSNNTAVTSKPLSPTVGSPITGGSTTVSGAAAEAGANVQLYVNGSPRGASVAANGTGQWTVVGLSPALAVGDSVTARQTVNGVQSDPSTAVIVVSGTPVLTSIVVTPGQPDAGGRHDAGLYRNRQLQRRFEQRYQRAGGVAQRSPRVCEHLHGGCGLRARRGLVADFRDQGRHHGVDASHRDAAWPRIDRRHAGQSDHSHDRHSGLRRHRHPHGRNEPEPRGAGDLGQQRSDEGHDRCRQRHRHWCGRRTDDHQRDEERRSPARRR